MKRIVSFCLALSLPTLSAATAAAGTGRASVALTNAAATISQTSNTDWKLEKTGALDPSSSTVTWTITATQQAAVSGKVFVTGYVAATNQGTLGATVGNIVVNLQTKSGSEWETQSSDIADATNGDGATTAQIDPHASSEGQDSFTENAASGTLEFMDANSNTAFSLRPQVTIAPGATVNLLFAAEFDNTVLKLDTGTPVRAEVIVSFGNAGPGPSSASDVDINGNGTIDADEAWVHSVPARLGLTVPAETAANDSVTLTDTASDIATTGTATVSNPTFDLATTSGTVTAQYSGGTDGGEITNCAHLKGTGSTVTVGSYSFPDIPGADLQACNTETIGAATCTPGTAGCGWQGGDQVTYSQLVWGNDPSVSTAAALLQAKYFTVYASTAGAMTVGAASPGYSMVFLDPTAVLTYLPTSGAVAPLNADLIDPTSSSSGEFGGDVTALELNVDFSDHGELAASSTTTFGDLTLCDYAALPTLDGMSVRQVLALANAALSGEATGYSLLDVDAIAQLLDNAFPGGGASSFAQQNLVVGACPVWKSGDFTTYNQDEWGEPATATNQTGLLIANFDALYPGLFEVGISGTTGNFMLFKSADAIIAYLPAAGPAETLTVSLVDPTDSPTGSFGGEVVALKLNIDFSDAGIIHSTSGAKFGDLTLCGPDLVPALNGVTVREVLAMSNTVLGGGTGPFTAGQLVGVANVLNTAFDDGVPSTFAQNDLVSGTCPASP
jgi:hypothetical protein